jgi:predicted ABC-type ATPase
MNTLYIFRGVPGSGKTTVAELLKSFMSEGVCKVFSADDHLTDSEGNYKWSKEDSAIAHDKSFYDTSRAMRKSVKNIFVCNVFLKRRSTRRYTKLAEANNYRIVSLIVENYHGSENVHDVPEDIVQSQRDSFQFKL